MYSVSQRTILPYVTREYITFGSCVQSGFPSYVTKKEEAENWQKLNDRVTKPLRKLIVSISLSFKPSGGLFFVDPDSER